MVGMNLGIFGAVSQKLAEEKIAQIIVWVGAWYIFLLCALYAAKICLGARRARAGGAPRLALAFTPPAGEFSGEALEGGAEIAREATRLGVTMASVQVIVARLREAARPAAQIPGRLREALEALARLRAALLKEESSSPIRSLLRAEALTCLDRGDFAAAAAALVDARGGEIGTDGEAAEARAELLIEAAQIDHLLLDYRAAA